MSTTATWATDAVPTVLAEELPDGSVRCGVCAHRCLVRPGRQGICGVRENRGGTLMSHGLRPGRRDRRSTRSRRSRSSTSRRAPPAYSIATVGCPFHCTFCQNWEIAQGPGSGWRSRPGRCARAGGAEALAPAPTRSPTPTSSRRSSSSTRSTSARLARAAGLRNLFITDGYAHARGDRPAGRGPRRGERGPQVVRRRLLPPTVRGAARARARGDRGDARGPAIWLELTTLVIPGRNDDEAQLRALAGWIVERPRPRDARGTSAASSPRYRMRDVPPTPLATLRRAAEIGREAGLAPRVRRQRPGAGPRGHALRRLRRGCSSSGAATGSRSPLGRRRLPGLRAAAGAGADRPGPGRAGRAAAPGREVTDDEAARQAAPATRSGRPAVAGTFYPADPAASRPRRRLLAAADRHADRVDGRPRRHPRPPRGARLLRASRRRRRCGGTPGAGRERPAEAARTEPDRRSSSWARTTAPRGSTGSRSGRRAPGRRRSATSRWTTARGGRSWRSGRPFVVDRAAPRATSTRSRSSCRSSGPSRPGAGSCRSRSRRGPATTRSRPASGSGRLLAGRRAAGERVVLAISTDMAHYPRGRRPAPGHADACCPRSWTWTSPRLARLERAIRQAGIRGLVCGMCGIEPTVARPGGAPRDGRWPGDALAAATSADAGGPADRTVGYLSVAFPW